MAEIWSTFAKKEKKLAYVITTHSLGDTTCQPANRPAVSWSTAFSKKIITLQADVAVFFHFALGKN